jgi:hypothetical protein
MDALGHISPLHAGSHRRGPDLGGVGRLDARGLAVDGRVAPPPSVRDRVDAVLDLSIRTALTRSSGIAPRLVSRLRFRSPPDQGGLPALAGPSTFVRVATLLTPRFPTVSGPPPACASRALLRRRVRGVADRCRSTAPVPSMGFFPLRGSPSTAGVPSGDGASIPPPVHPEPEPEGPDTDVGGVCPVGSFRGCPR